MDPHSKKRTAQRGSAKVRKAGGPAAVENRPVIQTRAEAANLAERLASCPIIAIDTEFLREKTFYPKLGLIQLADREDAWLLDPLALSKGDLAPLLELWTDPAVLKVMHSAEQDQECLHHDYGIVATPLLDTSIAAALTGLGDQIGLGPLLTKLMGVKVPKHYTRADWLKRPLAKALADYALEDVRFLVEAAERLLTDLDRRGRRDWAMKLSAEWADAARFEPNPDEVARKLAVGRGLGAETYAVLRELVRWREQRVRDADLPRRWVAEDGILLKLASARPTQGEELSHFRGLGKSARQGEAILKVIKRGMALSPEKRPTPPPRREPAEASEAPSVSMLKCFLSLLARQHELPARYLVDPDDVVKLLRGRFRGVKQLRESGLLKPGAEALVAEELLEVLQGRRALRLTEGRVEQYEPAR